MFVRIKQDSTPRIFNTLLGMYLAHLFETEKHVTCPRGEDVWDLFRKMSSTGPDLQCRIMRKADEARTVGRSQLGQDHACQTEKF